MGEIADDMIEGRCCELCGAYFVEEHGFPVICIDCWRSCDEEEKLMYHVSQLEEL